MNVPCVHSVCDVCVSWHNPLWCEYFFRWLFALWTPNTWYCSKCNMLNTQNTLTHTHTSTFILYIFHQHNYHLSVFTRTRLYLYPYLYLYYSCWHNITQVYWICQLEFVIYHDQIISKSIAIQISPLHEHGTKGQQQQQQQQRRQRGRKTRGIGDSFTHSKV